MKPRESIRPRFSSKEAQDMALEFWNIRSTARQLPSERDQNSHIQTAKIIP
jgi:hypothetical protein